MNPTKMRERLAEIEAARRALHEEAGQESLTDEQQQRWDDLDTEEAQLRADLAEAEAAEARAQRVAESRARWQSLQVGTKPGSPFEGIDTRASDDDLRARAVTALSEVRYAGVHIPDDARQAAVQTVERVSGAAAHALVHGSPEYLSAFRAWLKSAGQPVLTQAEAEAVRTAMSLTSANGGYMLPTFLDPTLIHTGDVTKNPIRQIATVKTGTTPVWNGVTVGAVTTAWKGEGAAFTGGEPTFGGAAVTAHALTAYVTGSYEVFQDTDALSDLPGLIAEAIDLAEGVAFVTGSGTGAPKGIVTALAGVTGSLVTATTRGTFDAGSGVDTLRLFNAIPERYEDRATWVGNKATFVTIQQQTFGTAGGLLSEMLVKDTLLGSPVKKASSVTSATTSGNHILVLGDFSQYIVYDRIGVNLEFIQNVVDGDGKPTGQRGLVAYKRVGADAVVPNAFRVLKV